jgi:L-threonylcarbamoyladenylate synthase
MIITASLRSLHYAVQLLKDGDLVAFPTETVYGLGVDPHNEEAVKKLFALKQRPATNPLIVHVESVEAIEHVADLSDALVMKRLNHLRRFMPGPLSVVVPKHPSISKIVTAGSNLVAVRIPQHSVAQQLLKLFSGPIAAPSANRSTRISPTTARHVITEFGSKVFVLDGGPTSVGLESTVVSLIGSKPTLFRPGAITIEMLERACDEEFTIKSSNTDEESAQSPGLSRVHYAPQTPLILLSEPLPVPIPKRIGLITLSSRVATPNDFPYAVVRSLSQSGDLEEVARHLFATLRELDESDLDLIVIEPSPQVGIGAAIMDRLRRATARTQISY